MTHYSAQMVGGGSFEADTIPTLAQKIVNWYTEDGVWADLSTPMVDTLYLVDDTGETTEDHREWQELDRLITRFYKETVDEIVASIKHEKEERTYG